MHRGSASKAGVRLDIYTPDFSGQRTTQQSKIENTRAVSLHSVTLVTQGTQGHVEVDGATIDYKHIGLLPSRFTADEIQHLEANPREPGAARTRIERVRTVVTFISASNMPFNLSESVMREYDIRVP